MNKSVNAKSSWQKKQSPEDDMNIVSQLASQAAVGRSMETGDSTMNIVRATESMFNKSTIVRPDVISDDDIGEGSLRPLCLNDFMGQSEIKKNLGTFIKAAKARGDALDHLFLIGPPGLGKTTLAQITANELGADFKVTSAPALDKPKDLAGILSTITPNTVFFIDEIHRLKPAIEEMLLYCYGRF